MDCIIFHIGDVTIQLGDGVVILTHFDTATEHEERIELPIRRLEEALSTARMLRKPDAQMGRLYGACADV